MLKYTGPQFSAALWEQHRGTSGSLCREDKFLMEIFAATLTTGTELRPECPLHQSYARQHVGCYSHEQAIGKGGKFPLLPVRTDRHSCTRKYWLRSSALVS